MNVIVYMYLRTGKEALLEMVEGTRGLEVGGGSQRGGRVNEVRPVYALNAFLPSVACRVAAAGRATKRNGERNAKETIPGDQRRNKIQPKMFLVDWWYSALASLGKPLPESAARRIGFGSDFILIWFWTRPERSATYASIAPFFGHCVRLFPPTVRPAKCNCYPNTEDTGP